MRKFMGIAAAAALVLYSSVCLGASVSGEVLADGGYPLKGSGYVQAYMFNEDTQTWDFQERALIPTDVFLAL